MSGVRVLQQPRRDLPARQSGSPPRKGQDPEPRAWPWAAVAATVVWSLWELRATVLPAQYLNDSSVHEQMARFATAQLRAGHDPLTSWFPYLGLGSPQFLHYQSAPAILTGLAGTVAGPDVAFRWSLYLLWCLWPVAIYCSARLLRLNTAAAAFAAVVAPLLHSVPGVGYEQHAYVWTGYGLWTQLWGSWALPFAWALSWRAMADKRFIAPAAALVALTVAFHYETGYLAFGAVLIIPFLVRAGIRARLARAGVLLATALLASAWVVVPLLLYARWAGINQALASGPLANGYGARVTAGWLVTGQVFDYGRLPVVSLLAAAGLVTALLRWRQAGPGRVLVALLCACLLLSFGRTTFGSLISIVPGSSDLFFRRFLMGAQLAGIYLAGLGAAEAAGQGRRLAAACAGFLTTRRLTRLNWLPAVALTVAGVAYLFPAWRYLDSYDAVNSAGIHAQQRAQAQDRPQIAALAAYLRRHRDGRAYAGSLSTGGQDFTVGQVPMFKYLESLDADEVGYTLRTASLMTQPEFRFDSASPGDFALFGIRYIIVPATSASPSSSRGGLVLVLSNRLFRVFKLPASGYLRVADTVGTITANRADVGSQTVPYLRSPLPGEDRYLTVAWPGARAAAPTLAPRTRAAGPPGTVLAARADLADGRASAMVHLRRRATVVLSASFDPGWSVTVDGRPAAVQLVAPALVAVAVSRGTHRIAFRYTGFAGYPELLALAAIALLAVPLITRRRPGAACPPVIGGHPMDD